MIFLHRWVNAVAVMFLICGVAVADEARELTWDDLVMKQQLVPQLGGAGLRPDEQFVHDPNAEVEGYNVQPSWSNEVSGVVEALDGALVKLPGFIVPLAFDGDGKVTEFLLVPYFGACIHYPPPPPNQIVYVTAAEPIDIAMTWEAIWATGKLKTGMTNSEYGSAGYSMKAQTIEIYEY